MVKNVMKKILMVADVPNWIFSRHCKEITKRLNNEFNFTTIFRDEVNNYDYSWYNFFDLIYILDARLSIPYNLKEKTVIGIRGEFYYSYDKLDSFIATNLSYRCKAIHTVNKMQFCSFKLKFPNTYFAPHGVDTNIFKPIEKEFTVDNIKVGIMGNPNSGGNKGFDIIANACKYFKNIELVSAYQNLSNGHKTINDMVKFYQDIDIFINMSESEGLNNGILEAGACKKFVIASDINGNKDLIKHMLTGMISFSRSEKELIEKLEYLIKYPCLVPSISNSLYKLINEHYSWDISIDLYRNLFKENLK